TTITIKIQTINLYHFTFICSIFEVPCVRGAPHQWVYLYNVPPVHTYIAGCFPKPFLPQWGGDNSGRARGSPSKKGQRFGCFGSTECAAGKIGFLIQFKVFIVLAGSVSTHGSKWHTLLTSRDLAISINPLYATLI